MELAQQRIRGIDDEVREYKQDLAAAKLAKDEKQEDFCREMLLKLQDEKTVLWQCQAPGDSFHQLVPTGLRVYLLHCIQFRHMSNCMWEDLYTGANNLKSPSFNCDAAESCTCRVPFVRVEYTQIDNNLTAGLRALWQVDPTPSISFTANL